MAQFVKSDFFIDSAAQTIELASKQYKFQLLDDSQGKPVLVQNSVIATDIAATLMTFTFS